MASSRRQLTQRILMPAHWFQHMLPRHPIQLAEGEQASAHEFLEAVFDFLSLPELTSS
jgi:hypothetical protein